jgi:hypothetical protein
MKIPEMKTSGNLISEESIMMFEGTFVGGSASSIPIAVGHDIRSEPVLAKQGFGMVQNLV